MKIKKTFIIWLFLVVLWNFGVPGAAPIYDVLVAVALSFFAKFIEEKVK
tara:strand:+ start:697 stop:843 length:147 start_codon:yes stop_codon:yes gene_type:complete